jgi:outer membrane lipoprotein-sorting protein
MIMSLLLNWESIAAQPKGFIKIEDHTPVKVRMKKTGEEQQTIQSAFTQIKRMEYLDIAIESTGEFWYSAPSKVRWEYMQPYEYIIIINQGKLSLISEASTTEFNLENSDVFEQINKLMVGSVTGNIFDSDDYLVEVFENDKQYFFSLVPRAEFTEGVISGIEMLIDKEQGSVRSIKIIENAENFTEISFYNIRLNEIIPEKIFAP